MIEFGEDFDPKISEQKTGIEICANEKTKKKNKRRARCRCARSNERGNVLGLRLRSHSERYHTTGFHFGGCSHLWPVPCALEEVSYPLRYVAFILTRRVASFHGLFAFTLVGLYPLTCRWPLYRTFLRSHLQVDFHLQLMASLRGLFVTYMEMVFLVSHSQLAGLFVFAVTATWPLYVHTPHI